MSRTITLLDGEHTLNPPTFYALQLMSEYGVVLGESDLFRPTVIAGILAAILTDSEPFIDGAPAKVWTPAMAAKVVAPDQVADVLNTITAMINESLPDTDDKPAERPTKARAGSK